MKTYTVHFAHTGERQHVTAADWQTALRTTGRADACLIERVNNSTLEATFVPDAPMIISCRLHDGQGDANDHIRWALACAQQHLDAVRAGAGEVAV